MLTRTNHGELGDLPTPIYGHLSDSHMRAVTFDANTASGALLRAGQYLREHDLDDYVAAVTYFHREPGEDPAAVMVVLEAMA